MSSSYHRRPRLGLVIATVAAAVGVSSTHAFVLPTLPSTSSTRLASTTTTTAPPTPPPPSESLAPTTFADTTQQRKELKAALFRSLGQQPPSSSSHGGDDDGLDRVLACPLTLKPVRRVVRLAGPFGQIANMISSSGSKYPANEVYMDLVPQDARNQIPFFSPTTIITQELFRSPLTSFLYERGWRDKFKTAGFPGIDTEFLDLEIFMSPLLLPAATVEALLQDQQKVRMTSTTIVDLSCGSGLMARRLVRSKKWDRVIAADFSESMLRETRRRFVEEKLPVPELVRADASRLPFQTDSVDGIHAGAALHCWPRLEESLRECLRVLKPGGRMYASTFEVSKRLQSNTFRFFKLEELTRLFVASGFGEVEVRREGVACLIVKAVKKVEEA